MAKVYPRVAGWRLMEEMRVCVRLTIWVGAVMLAAGAAVAQAPSAPATPQCDATTKTDCKAAPAAPAKSTAQRFPFPGEDSSAPDKPADLTPDAPAGTPDAPPAQRKAPKTPLPAYPGDPDAPATNGPEGSSSSSSSNSLPGDSGSPDDSGPLADAGSSGDTTKPQSGRRRLPKTTPETPESRAAEDLTVADFYQKDGNYLGAYERAKDAVQYQPDDPYTHFALAEAAFKLGKRDEAKEQYAQVLKLDPIPKQMKAAQKALEELASAKKK